jgi:hypothetical protein
MPDRNSVLSIPCPSIAELPLSGTLALFLADIDERETLAVGNYLGGFFWQEFKEKFNPSTAQP